MRMSSRYSGAVHANKCEKTEGGWHKRGGVAQRVRLTLRVVQLLTKLDGALEGDLDDLFLQLLQPLRGAAP